MSPWEWFQQTVGPTAAYGYDGKVHLERGTAKQWREWRLRRAQFLGTHTADEWANLVAAADSVCSGCGQRGEMTKDHIKSLARGGCDCIQNIQPLCKNCNSRKRCRVEMIP